jgi:hypothetical protein
MTDMPFLHPNLLWAGLAGASIPVIIHLINRRRFRVQTWAAMQFLLESLRRYRRRLQLEELLLLLLRCLIVAVLGLTLARFTGCSGLKGVKSASGLSTTILVLDDSYSMGQQLGASTAFDMAVEDLIERLESLPDSETVGILLTSDSETAWFFEPNYITDRTSLVAKLRTLAPSDGSADLAAAMRRAGNALADQAGGHKHVVILSDFRQCDLAQERRGAIGSAFDHLADNDVNLATLDYGYRATSNLQIESLRLLDKSVIVGVPAHVAVTIRNVGDMSAEHVPLALTLRYSDYAAGDDNGVVTIELPQTVADAIAPGESVSVEAVVTCPQPGGAALEAGLPDDELPGDNTAFLTLDVRPQLRVLLVDGHWNTVDPVSRASYYFALTADPRGEGRWGVSVDTISANDLTSVDYDAYDVVALMDVASMAVTVSTDGERISPALEALEAYVAGGGGLVIYTGERLDLDFYNSLMFRNGHGLSPYRIGPPEGNPNRWDAYVRLDGESIDPTHPVMWVFQGPRRALTNLVRFFAYTPAEEIDLGEAVGTGEGGNAYPIGPPRVLARFTDANHSPALVTRSFGDGQVLMIYTTAGRRWTDWVDDQPQGLYTGLVHDMIQYLARPQHERAGTPVGQPLVYDLPAEVADAAISLRLPDFPASDLVTLTPTDRQDGLGREVRYDAATQAGIYVVSARLPGQEATDVLLTRRVDPAEGLLAPGGREAITAAFGSKEFTYVARATESIQDVMLTSTGEEYWLWTMGALIVLLAAETLLAQRLGHYATESDVKAIPR